ncbi:MAG: M28 family peptidase [Deltaproteobacteria bacterium]|nr:M28 family peptidase [Deltaproteobacteria bacterium]
MLRAAVSTLAVSVALLAPVEAQAKALARAPGKAKKAAPVPDLGFPSAAELRARAEELVKASGGNRTAGREGGARAYAWLLAEARKLKGWEVEEQSFTPDLKFAREGFARIYSGADPKDFNESPAFVRQRRQLEALNGLVDLLKDKTGHNLILRKKGSQAERASQPLVLTAHYDTIAARLEPLAYFPDAKAPGGDDNASGVVALLSIASVLGELKPARPVELVFTDCGEQFYLGAHAYAERLRKSGATADDITLEMIGYDGTSSNQVNDPRYA